MTNKQQIYWFYKNEQINLVEIDDKFSFNFFKPTIFNLKLHQGSVLLYLFWYIFSFGKYQIFYIIDKRNNKVAHYSNILPKIFKYSFMKKNDWQIVNVFTFSDYRRHQLYQFALAKILSELKGTNIWIGTRNDNIASINGIVKAGFKKAANASKTRVFGIYKLNE